MTDGVMSSHLELLNYLECFRSSLNYDEKLHSKLQTLIEEDNRRIFRSVRYPKRNDRPRLFQYSGSMTLEELVYFGSPLNKEIFLRSFTKHDPPDEGLANVPEELKREGRPSSSRNQSCCNLDLVNLKEDQRRLQIIESKHSREAPPSEGQKKILYRLANLFRFGNLHSRGSIDAWEFEFYLITGDEPYMEGAEILNLLSPVQFRDKRFATEEELFDLLSFRIRFEDIKKKERK